MLKAKVGEGDEGEDVDAAGDVESGEEGEATEGGGRRLDGALAFEIITADDLRREIWVSCETQRTTN